MLPLPLSSPGCGGRSDRPPLGHGKLTDNLWASSPGHMVRVYSLRLFPTMESISKTVGLWTAAWPEPSSACWFFSVPAALPGACLLGLVTAVASE